jgi:hypothetical protein
MGHYVNEIASFHTLIISPWLKLCHYKIKILCKFHDVSLVIEIIHYNK